MMKRRQRRCVVIVALLAVLLATAALSMAETEVKASSPMRQDRVRTSSGSAVSEPHTDEDFATESLCSSLTTCDACAERAGCHYCASDRSCHTFLSTSGCSVGLSCRDLHQCYRAQPERIGYGSPPASAIAIFVVGAVFLLAAVAGLMRLSKRTLRRKWDEWMRSDPDAAAEYLRRMNLADGGADSSMNPSYFEMASIDSQRIEESAGAVRRSAPADRAGRRQSAIAAQQMVEQRIGGLGRTYRCLKWVLIALLIIVPIGATVGVLYWPQDPQYSFCNSEIDWAGVFRSAVSFRLEAKVEVLFSIYNPNRFDIQVSGASAEFLYRSQTIGSASLGATTFMAGRVTDVILPTKFNPSLASATRALIDHELGHLFVDVSMELHSDIYAFDRHVYALNASYVGRDVDVEGDPDPQVYCNCKPTD